MSIHPSHYMLERFFFYARRLPGRLMHRLSDTIGYGNLSGPLDMIIVQALTFLSMSGLGYIVLSLSGLPMDEESRRTACLELPAMTAPFPSIVLNNLHRFKIAIDRFLLTGDILQRNPALSVPQAYRIGGRLMLKIKQAVGYNWRPACQYMKSEYPILLAMVVERVRVTSLTTTFDENFA